MSKITNNGLTRSGTECFTDVPIVATVGVKGLTKFLGLSHGEAKILLLYLKLLG